MTRLTLWVVIVMAAAGSAGAAEFYVSPSGNDDWAGTASRPFASLQRARDAARSAEKPVTVCLRKGTYYLASTLELGPEDSGTRYCAHKGESATISGGRQITGFMPVEINGRKMLAADLPDARNGGWSFTQLFVNGRRCPRTRLPKTGYYRIAGLDEVPDNYATPQDRFRFKTGDLNPSWKNIDDIDVVALHFWVSVRTGIKSIDEAAQTVHLTKPSRRRLTSDFNKSVFARYFVENVFEALDTPGQWYLDRQEGRLYYYPLVGQVTEHIAAVAPRLETIVKVRGASNVAFRDLNFAHTEYRLPQGDAGDRQGSTIVPGAVILEDCTDCRLENCVVSQVGTCGIEIGAGSNGCKIERCAVRDLGAGGVKINAGSKSTTIADNNICDGGRIHRQALGVCIGDSGDNFVVHNRIHDFDYTGVSVGWKWGYGKSAAANNLVEFNHIYNIGRGILSDMGGIYTLGVSPGTRLANNLIHDVRSDTYGGWGIYTDEGSSNIVIENNVVYNTKSGGFHQHYGRENVIRNNVFAFAKDWQIQRTRLEEHTVFTFERNIVYYDQGALLGGHWSDNNAIMDHNLYWNASGGPVTFLKDTPEDWRKRGHDEHSVIADPLFVDAKKRDFRLKPDSPAFRLGFRRIDVSTVGPRHPVGPKK